ncbi:diguanylate cyclase [Crenobacter sp. SG2305]|uniref:sensor domain-containing diguanylate cyclase n=1 Tax=Crenobacter oryzisoli TaxID=3056844 RepID=UPI0025AAD042|nr:sensor domain-containing diguanylate cyclase [Crenobacter sp. SG2305]MDN0084702.1 diguanylate cyclase [Crenobacter sp. SG2305]
MSDQLEQTILRLATRPLGLVNAGWSLLDANAALRRCLGVESSRPLTSMPDWLGHRWPRDPDYIARSPADCAIDIPQVGRLCCRGQINRSDNEPAFLMELHSPLRFKAHPASFNHSDWRTLQLTKSLEQERGRFRATFEEAPLGICHVLPDGSFLRVNRTFCDITGYSEVELLRRTFRDITHADDLAADMAHIELMLAGSIRRYTLNKRYLRRDGTFVWAELTVSLVRTPDGRPSYFIAMIEDISERIRTEERLRLAAKVYEHMCEGVFIADRQLNLLSVNPAFAQMTGFCEADCRGLSLTMLLSERQPPNFLQTLSEQLHEWGTWQGDVWFSQRSGRTFPAWLSISGTRGQSGEWAHYVGVFSDISLLKQNEAQLYQLAHHDPLTAIPNRLLLQSRLEHAINLSQRQRKTIALVFIDLDDFKTINDTHGHLAGDQVLITVAQRLSNRLRSGDTVARLGGDEFVILVENTPDEFDMLPFITSLLDCIREPIAYKDGVSLTVSASVGVSLYPHHGEDAVSLIDSADRAMLEVKQAGKNAPAFSRGRD